MWQVDPKSAAGLPLLPPKPGKIGLLTFATIGAKDAVYEIESLWAKEAFTGNWTNWSYSSLPDGLAKLKAIRMFIRSDSLFRTYNDGALSGNLASPSDAPCTFDPASVTTRTLDGSCNYLKDPLAGAAGTRMGRNIPLSRAFPDAANLLNPNPLLVSAKLLRRQPPAGGSAPAEAGTVPYLNILGAAWAQFMANDWWYLGAPDDARPIGVPVPPSDPQAALWPGGNMTVGSLPQDGTRIGSEAWMPPTFINKVTHWWDASQLYGSDNATASRLRDPTGGGRLKLDGGYLPLGPGGQSDAGLTEGWWLGLELLHTIFTKEHNAIAAALQAANPTFTDDQLFHKARMVNAAVIAKIHTLEWLPAVLPTPILNASMTANWQGLAALGTKGARKWLAQHRKPPNEGLWGFKGWDRVDSNVTFHWTEEYYSAARFDPLVPETLNLKTLQGASLGAPLPVANTTGAAARAVAAAAGGWAAVAGSLGTQMASRLALHNYPSRLTQAQGTTGVLDWAAVHVLQDRERGVPRYNEFRRLLRLKPLGSIDDITDSADDRAALREVYGDNIELVDLLPGMLAESHRMKCIDGTLSETMYQLYPAMGSRRLGADRFYSSDWNTAAYTARGLQWVEGRTFAKVLLDHLPQLANQVGSKLAGTTKNAFYPWHTLMPGM